MSNLGKFKRRALLLFVIVSILPAITVSALWYTLARQLTTTSYITIGNFVAPVAFLGLLPALLVGVIFAEVLAIPIRRLHQGITEIANGNLTYRVPATRVTEFHDMSEQLNRIAANLQGTISQKDSETGLIAAERNKLQAVLNNMSDGVVAIDKANHIVMVNQAALELTGYKFEEAAGKPLGKIVSLTLKGKAVVLSWLLEKPLSSEASKQWKELELECKNGEILQVDAECSLLPNDPNGIRMLMTFHDLTRGRQLEQMEVSFVALAAHELRTPITTTRGYLDILADELSKGPKDAKELVKRSQLGIDQLATLVNNLLNVSRIEQGELLYHMEPVEWTSFMAVLKKELIERLNSQDRKLVISIDKNLPKVAVDTTGISEIFYNLVDNSVKNTEPGSIITISSTASHDGIQTTVTDTGKGIPKDSLGRLFQKFYRVEGLRSHSGTGLGLYICKQIAEAHYGYMWAESEGEGQGATFGLNLPAYSKIASKLKKDDNKTKVIRGTHGWIKTNSAH